MKHTKLLILGALPFLLVSCRREVRDVEPEEIQKALPETVEEARNNAKTLKADVESTLDDVEASVKCEVDFTNEYYYADINYKGKNSIYLVYKSNSAYEVYSKTDDFDAVIHETTSDDSLFADLKVALNDVFNEAILTKSRFEELKKMDDGESIKITEENDEYTINVNYSETISGVANTVKGYVVIDGSGFVKEEELETTSSKTVDNQVVTYTTAQKGSFSWNESITRRKSLK